MELFKWNDDLKVGIDELDKEHKIMVDMLNYLFNALRTGQDKSILIPIIENLIHDVEIHFSNEEKLFKKYNYPKSIEHTVEHELFKKDIHNFFDDYKKGKLELSGQFMKTISDWVSHHIRVADKEYSDFFRKNKIIK